MSGGISIDTSSFRATLREYMEYTKRDIGTVLNTKAFYISRGAVQDTLKTAAIRIEGDMLKESRINPKAPLGAIIINSRRGALGKKGLQGQDMQRAFDRMVSARVRTRAFVASGFLEAVKRFGTVAERKGQARPLDRSVKSRGSPKGSAVLAKNEWTAYAEIINRAVTNYNLEHGGTKGLLVYGTEGLQAAFDREEASMKQYIEDHMQKTADKFNAK